MISDYEKIDLEVSVINNILGKERRVSDLQLLVMQKIADVQDATSTNLVSRRNVFDVAMDKAFREYYEKMQ